VWILMVDSTLYLSSMASDNPSGAMLGARTSGSTYANADIMGPRSRSSLTVSQRSGNPAVQNETSPASRMSSVTSIQES
jgi:hypothetical protein